MKLFQIEVAKDLHVQYYETRKAKWIATIALENDVLEKIKYEDIIEDFISKNTKRMMLFNRT